MSSPTSSTLSPVSTSTSSAQPGTSSAVPSTGSRKKTQNRTKKCKHLSKCPHKLSKTRAKKLVKDKLEKDAKEQASKEAKMAKKAEIRSKLAQQAQQTLPEPEPTAPVPPAESASELPPLFPGPRSQPTASVPPAESASELPPWYPGPRPRPAASMWQQDFNPIDIVNLRNWPTSRVRPTLLRYSYTNYPGRRTNNRTEDRREDLNSNTSPYDEFGLFIPASDDEEDPAPGRPRHAPMPAHQPPTFLEIVRFWVNTRIFYSESLHHFLLVLEHLIVFVWMAGRLLGYELPMWRLTKILLLFPPSIVLNPHPRLARVVRRGFVPPQPANRRGEPMSLRDLYSFALDQVGAVNELVRGSLTRFTNSVFGGNTNVAFLVCYVMAYVIILSYCFGDFHIRTYPP